jgi:5-formyltetrahydrofolate cyclo-ligase
MVKHSLRKDMLAKRDSISGEERLTASRMIMQELFSRPKFQEAKVIGFYLAKGSEVDTSEMIKETLKMGKEVAVPVTNHMIEFCRFTSFDDLAKGKFGILEPKHRTPATPDLIIVPGVVFGRCMHRIGYGKGYYDSHLAGSSAYRIGICYDFQVMGELPKHEKDIPMDEILTEKRIIR